MGSYNSIMSRWVSALLFSGLLALPASAQEKPKPAAPRQIEQAPPEEDENLKVKEYSFNPLQANKELLVGNEYFKKHSYKAAAGREYTWAGMLSGNSRKTRYALPVFT